MLELKNTKIIRQLGQIESIYDNEVINNNMTQAKLFIVNISKKYLIDLSVLKKALKLFIEIHPLLQATVFRNLDEHTLKSQLFI